MAAVDILTKMGVWAPAAKELGQQSIISGQGATRTLKQGESGSLCLFDKVDGIVYTLPAPKVGLYFDFLITASITSNLAKVITDGAATFILGAVEMFTIATASPAGFAANGAATVFIGGDATTKGGLAGGNFRLTCVSATQWAVTGTLVGSGTIVTPFG